MPDGTKKPEAEQPVPLTSAQVRVYCENSGIICPRCLSNDLRITGSPELVELAWLAYKLDKLPGRPEMNFAANGSKWPAGERKGKVRNGKV